MKKVTKNDLLKKQVEHINIASFDSSPIINQFREMSFVARETANAADIYVDMLSDKKCTVILTIAGSATAAGCMQLVVDLIENNMVDVIVATGATIVDMDFFEALGGKHFQGSQFEDDEKLRKLGIDRIYDTYIEEDQLQICDKTIKIIADSLPCTHYSSQEFIYEMGRYLSGIKNCKQSMVKAAFEKNIPIFSPAFTDSSAGFGLVLHQNERKRKNIPFITIDSIKDFHDLTKVVAKAQQKGGTTGLFMIGGGTPKNFAQDTVVCGELLNYKVGMHKYAAQITVADVRDGACSSSTLKEANSWGKVRGKEQMVYGEATVFWPLIASYAMHWPVNCIPAFHEPGWRQIRGLKEYAEFIANGGEI
ncbi:MAG: deoxyhypusine synthase family protein [Patescibacteria group bacterium]